MYLQQNILQQKMTPKKLKSGLGASYDLWRENKMGLFWKQLTDRSGCKWVRKKVEGKKNVNKKESKKGGR